MHFTQDGFIFEAEMFLLDGKLKFIHIDQAYLKFLHEACVEADDTNEVRGTPIIFGVIQNAQILKNLS